MKKSKNIRSVPYEWMKGLKRTSGGKSFEKTMDNVCFILENDPSFSGKIAYDEFKNQITIKSALPWDKEYKGIYPRDWTDGDRALLSVYCERLIGMSSQSKIDTAFIATAKSHSFHPIRQYLNGLKWDGIQRLDTLFIDYLGVSDSPYARAVTRKAFTAAVGRVMCPGVKFDTMIILCGPQGGYKSTILRLMGTPWFSDSLRTFEGKDAMEGLLGKWILEIAELNAMNKSELNATKNFLSKTEDSFRAAYGHFNETHPRQCIFFGTTNSRTFLKDITGGRRFFPMETDAQKRKKNVIKDLPKERDLIWAEALARWKDKESLYLPPELEKIAAEWQEDFREIDPWESIISEFVEHPVPTDWDSWDLVRRRMYWNGTCTDKHKLKTVCRRRVCAQEIWCEALRKEIADIRQVDSRRINIILENLPHWKKAGKMPPECIYGRQRAFQKQSK